MENKNKWKIVAIVNDGFLEKNPNIEIIKIDKISKGK